jgi:hypothetical protein
LEERNLYSSVCSMYALASALATKAANCGSIDENLTSTSREFLTGLTVIPRSRVSMTGV